MKAGARAVGVAESYRDDADRSTVAGCVVRADRVVDGVAFSQCTVGGMDVTDTITGLWETLDREDVHVVMVAGVALAWYNIVDLRAVANAVGVPVVAVGFEASEGLTQAITEAFDDPVDRLAVYESLPPRSAVTVNGEEVYVRAVGCPESRAQKFVDAFTPVGGRPEPLRVARVVARAGDSYRDADPG